MILVDTSVWIDHLRKGEPILCRLLEAGQVLTHPFIIGELACGNLNQRATIMSLLKDLPFAQTASNSEVLLFIDAQTLMGRGIGYIDAHLLAATALADEAMLWTRDKRLQASAKLLGLAWATPD